MSDELLVHKKNDRRKIKRPALFTQVNLQEILVSGIGNEIMSKSEAKDRGLLYYWPGAACPSGHQSLRRTTGQCWACSVIANREAVAIRKEKRKRVREEAKIIEEERTISAVDRQTVLEVLANTGDIEKAAEAIKITLPTLNVLIARSPAFESAIKALERTLRLQGSALKIGAKATPKPSDFNWTYERRETLIRTYVDTGDIATARDAIGATPSTLYAELEANPEFRERLKDAEKKAGQILEERAIQMGLRGNDRLITLILKAKKPEYKDSLKVEQNVNITATLSESQLNERIARLANKHNVGLIIDVEPEPSSSDEEGEGRTSSEPRRIGTSKDVQ